MGPFVLLAVVLIVLKLMGEIHLAWGWIVFCVFGDLLFAFLLIPLFLLVFSAVGGAIFGVTSSRPFIIRRGMR